MKKAAFFILFSALVEGPICQAALPQELAKIERIYRSKGTVVADFTQSEWNELTKSNRTTTGSLKVKMPNKLKWDQVEPEKSTLVSNGKIYWYYTPPFSADDNGQVVIMKAQKIQSKLATQLLTGRFSQIKGLQTRRLKPAGTFELKPKKGSAASVIRIEIQLDEQKSLVKKITLEHDGGNKTEIELNQIQLGSKLPDTDFEFSPPAKTEIIRE